MPNFSHCPLHLSHLFTPLFHCFHSLYLLLFKSSYNVESSCVCAYTCVHVYVCASMCSLACACAHVWVHLHEETRVATGCLPQSLATLLFRQGLSLNQEFTNSALLTGQRAPGILLRLPPWRWHRRWDFTISSSMGAREPSSHFLHLHHPGSQSYTLALLFF